MKSKKNTKRRFKIQRRLQTELPGLGKAGALERRPYPPGDHGQKRKKFSEYALQLEEKQKVRCHYDLREVQLKRFVVKAKAQAKTNWVSTLINLLEKRLDNIVFRLGFANSIAASSQLISHGKVLVNGKKLSIRSAVLKKGDKIQLVLKAYENQVYLNAAQAPRLALADYLSKSKESANGIDYEIGTIVDEPNFGHVPFELDEGLVTSYYSLKG